MQCTRWFGKAVLETQRSALQSCLRSVCENSLTACEQTASWSEPLVQSFLNKMHQTVCLTSTGCEVLLLATPSWYLYISTNSSHYLLTCTYPLQHLTQVDDTFLCIELYYCIWKREISRIEPVRLNLNKNGTLTVYKCMAKCLQIYISRKFTPKLFKHFCSDLLNKKVFFLCNFTPYDLCVGTV